VKFSESIRPFVMAALEASNLIDAEHFEKEVIELEKENEQLKQDNQVLVSVLIDLYDVNKDNITSYNSYEVEQARIIIESLKQGNLKGVYK
jgi:hypothetical protein